jgi:3-oxoacyl-ACP reductase-like protein
MSEEKPSFKITDRRLFNPDGSAREDVIREEEPAPAPEAAAPAAATARDETSATQTPDAAGAARAEDASLPRPEPSQEFLMLVEFVASFAADAMGMVNHPGDVGRGVNLPLAKQCIDMLGSLRDKTDGNLAAEEQQFLDTLLTQLRMQYVSLTNAPRPPQGKGGPRGFTGGDITGGM